MSIENPFQNNNAPEKEQKKEKSPEFRDLSPEKQRELGEFVRELRAQHNRE